MAFVLFRDQVEVADDAIFVLIRNLVPPGAKGLILAGMLSALMSTIAGALNSVSTLISIDIYQKHRPNATDADLLRVGRITAVAVMLCATAWSTMGDRFGGIFVGKPPSSPPENARRCSRGLEQIRLANLEL
jgi:SSS family solute:Na+ symporter